MARTPDTALVVDDNWQTAGEMRQELKDTGMANVAIACSDRMVLLAKEYFTVSFVCMPEAIKRDPAHPLYKSVQRHFPVLPIVSYSQQEQQMSAGPSGSRRYAQV